MILLVQQTFNKILIPSNHKKPMNTMDMNVKCNAIKRRGKCVLDEKGRQDLVRKVCYNARVCGENREK